MNKKNIIVIGASAGGVEVLKRLFSNLDPQINAAIFITWHMTAQAQGVLPKVLSKHSKLLIAHAVDHEVIAFNRVYIAPPDRHLLLNRGHVRVTIGPKENNFRPAVDPLFRSAAYAYGTRVIGVILSGYLDDGTAGLWTIKNFGGTTIVQDPEDAQFPSMPESALKKVQIDYKIRAAELATVLERLVNDNAVEKSIGKEEGDKTLREVRIAMMEGTEDENMIGHLGPWTPYTCPECHGVLSEIREGDIVRYRCHTGHGFSADILLSILSDSIEGNIWNAIRAMEESIFLMNSISDQYRSANQTGQAALYLEKAKDMESRAKHLRQAILKTEPLSKNFIDGPETVKSLQKEKN